MCGYINYDSNTIKQTPDLFDGYQTLFQQAGGFEAYPAFGGDTKRKLPLLIEEHGNKKWVQAIWWFDGFVDNTVTYLGHRTSFNARNIESPYWKQALTESRACIIASAIGESKIVGKTKQQYLLRSEKPFLLGALYRKLSNGEYCCAVITRDSHPKMEPYHDKAFPLFLPIHARFLSDWLSSKIKTSTPIESLLANPKLYPTLHVQRVKTYKDKLPVGHLNDVLMSDVDNSDKQFDQKCFYQQRLF